MGWQDAPVAANESWRAAPLVKPPTKGSAVRQEDDLAEPLGGNGAYGLIGVAETGIGMAGGLLGSAAGGLRGLYSLATGEGSETAADKVRATQEFWTYQPRTQVGQQITEAVAIPAELMARAGGAVGTTVGNVVGPQTGLALGAVGEILPAVGFTLLGGSGALAGARNRAARQQQLQNKANVTGSYVDAGRIDAAQTANRLGVAVDPAVSNPTVSNKLRTGVTGGRDVSAVLARSNEPKWTALAKEGIGLPITADLRKKATFDDAIAEVVRVPYGDIRNLGVLTVDDAAVSRLIALPKTVLIGRGGMEGVTAPLINDAVAKINSGLTGASALENIQSLRQDARRALAPGKKGNEVTKKARATADISSGIAAELEAIIEFNLATTAQIAAYRTARTKVGQINDVKRATNMATGQVDPAVFAQLVRDGKPVSGIVADIGNVAANFPKIAEVGATGVPAWQRRLTRSGPAGTIGLGIGAMFGMPLEGAIVGGGVGEAVSALNARRMTRPSYQAARAVPPDYRPPVNALTPAATANLPAIYQHQGSLSPEYSPNWVNVNPNRVVSPPSAQYSAPPGYNPRQLNAPVLTELQNNALNVAKARERQSGTAAYADELAARAAAEAEAARRVPAGTGQVYELDPVTGRLKSASEGLRGATPDLMASTGSPLASAVDKLSTGRAFAMSAEERIAWNTRKVDLESAVPGFSKLSDKAVAERMMDRQWVSDAVAKAREKARGFDEIGKRAESADKIRAASIERDRLMGVAEVLNEQLSNMPSTRTKTQGPKTKEAQRNALRGAEKNRNNLPR
jgi:hypothetical protein